MSLLLIPDTMNLRLHRIVRLMTCCLLIGSASAALAQPSVKIGEISRIKGQEPVTLQGFGIVVGLRGTGDGKSPLTLRKLARILEMSGNPVSKDTAGKYLSEELQDSKNVALVAVTATVPGEGAAEGDRFTCTVTAIAAKSLEGGQLLPTALLGAPGDNRVYALAQGPISVSDPTSPTFARIAKGCQLLETFEHPYLKDNILTLVVKPQLASFQMAYDLASTINQYHDPSYLKSADSGIARAKDATTIEIRVPEEYRNNVVQFISEIKEQRIILKSKPTRVIVDEREGTVVATDQVRIGPVIVTHRNLTIEAGQQLVAEFVDVDSEARQQSANSLEGLLQALRALKVPPRDVIAILRKINESGSLYAEFVDTQ